MNRVTWKTLTLVFILAVCSHGGASAKPASRIRRIDFQNFTFHQFWGRRPIKLKNGKLEFESKGCHTEYKLKGVNYVNLTDDRSEEALVHIQDFTACGHLAYPTITTFTRSKIAGRAYCGGLVPAAKVSLG